MPFRGIMPTCGENASQTDRIEKTVLLGVHQPKLLGIMIIMPGHMEKTMECVKNEFPKSIMPVLLTYGMRRRMPLGLLRL